MDWSKDGGIDKDEFKHAYGAESATEFDRVDTNHDHVVSKAEHSASYGGRRDAELDREWMITLRAQEVLERAAKRFLEGNNDGVIDRNELMHAHGA